MRSFEDRSISRAIFRPTSPSGTCGIRSPDYLRAARAVQCVPELFFVTSGGTQAGACRPRDPRSLGIETIQVWVEDPCYHASRMTRWATAAVRICPIPSMRTALNVRSRCAATAPTRAGSVRGRPHISFPVRGGTHRSEAAGVCSRGPARRRWIVEDGNYASVFRYSRAALGLAPGPGRRGAYDLIFGHSSTRRLFFRACGLATPS
jgi:hypothetical protein